MKAASSEYSPRLKNYLLYCEADKLNLKLLSLFVKDYKKTDDSRVRAKCAATASIVGIVSNLLLSLMKLVIGIISGSIAISADAVNNIADAASSIITLVGFKLAAKPADKEHPYGHARIEYITGLIVSMVICVLGIEFFINSINTLISPTQTDYSVIALVILGVSIVIKFWQGLFYRSVGRHIDSSALIATSADSRNDSITTAAVLIGALISRFSGVNLDGWLGVAVACFIVKSGIELILETSNPLLGTAPSEEFVMSIGKRIMSYDGVLGYHDLVVHSYGHDRIFASVHVEVAAERDILESHDLIDNIEFDFKKSGMQLVIHLDPVVTADEELHELRREVEAIIVIVSEELATPLSMHDFRVVRGVTHTNLIFDVVVPFECPKNEREVREIISKKIRTLSHEYNTVIEIDRSYL